MGEGTSQADGKQPEQQPEGGVSQAPGGQTPPGSGTPPQGQTPPGAAGGEQVESLPEWARALIGDLRRENAGHRKAKNEAEKAAQAADEKRLAEEKRWQELAEKRQTELQQIQDELQRLERAALQREVAQAAGLPPELARRLIGATREEMEADAKSLKKVIGTPAATPGAPAGPQRSGGGKPEETEAVRRRYGIKEPLKK